MISKLKIGARQSPLALVQAEAVVKKLAFVHNLPKESFSILPISTLGDRRTQESLSNIGGKGLFVKELELALLEGSIDIAVHSMKDMATQLHEDFMLGCILERADPRDAFVSFKAHDIHNLPYGATVGTASLRRQAYVQECRPDIRLSLLRGNVGTRLNKLAQGHIDATFLAMAGLERLNLHQEACIFPLPIEELIPAPAQGAIGVECLALRTDILELFHSLHSFQTALCITAERAFLRQLDGSCRTAIACHVEKKDDIFFLRGCVFHQEKKTITSQKKLLTLEDAEHFGLEAAKNLTP